MKKIWVISDTHCKHRSLKIPNGVDLIIHAGDIADTKQVGINSNEIRDFYKWAESKDVQFIIIPGNHDTSMESPSIRREAPDNVKVLCHEEFNYKGIKIFGSPYTPTFGINWGFNRRRDKIHKCWKDIPYNLDILITHGPPKGILDLTYANKRGKKLEQQGDSALLKSVLEKRPRYHVFGHFHDEDDLMNFGTYSRNSTTFINAACSRIRGEGLNQGVIIQYH